jgi:hypothetical protein
MQARADRLIIISAWNELPNYLCDCQTSIPMYPVWWRTSWYMYVITTSLRRSPHLDLGGRSALELIVLS